MLSLTTTSQKPGLSRPIVRSTLKPSVPSLERSTETRSVRAAASFINPTSIQLISTVLLGAGAWALLNQPQAHRVDQQSCPRCNGSGYEPCACLRWSDGDRSGCATCSHTGYAKCRSCGGGGTAVRAFQPIKMPPAAVNSPSTRSKSVAKAPSRHVSIVSSSPPPRAARKLKLDTSQTSPTAPSIAAHSAMSRSFLSALGPAAESAPAPAPPSYTLASLSAASTVSSHHPGPHHLLTHCSSTAMDQLPQRPGGLQGSDGGQGSPLLLDSPLRSLSRPSAFSVPSSPLRTRSQVAPLLASYDVVLWGGDLNYRIQGTPEVVRHLVETGMAEVLHANDQLRLQMRKGKVLQGLEEQAIHFPPTFKYVAHSEEYSLKRIPSWTDRILHACNAKPTICCLTPLYYSAVGELTSSDHRPVIAGYDLYITRPQSPSHKAAVPSLADNDNAAGLPHMPKQDQSPGWTLAASKTM